MAIPDRPSSVVVERIRQQFVQNGLLLTEGSTDHAGSFGIQYEGSGFRPTFVDVSDYFVRFSTAIDLSYRKVSNDLIGALSFVNDLNRNMTFAKAFLHLYEEDEAAGLFVSGILPELFEPTKVTEMHGVWQENLSSLVLHEKYAYYAAD